MTFTCTAGALVSLLPRDPVISDTSASEALFMPSQTTTTQEDPARRELTAQEVGQGLVNLARMRQCLAWAVVKDALLARTAQQKPQSSPETALQVPTALLAPPHPHFVPMEPTPKSSRVALKVRTSVLHVLLATTAQMEFTTDQSNVLLVTSA